MTDRSSASSDPGPVAAFRRRASIRLLIVLAGGIATWAMSLWIEGLEGMQGLAWTVLGPTGVAVTGFGVGGALILTPAVWTVSRLRWARSEGRLPGLGSVHLSSLLAAVVTAAVLVAGPVFRRDSPQGVVLRSALRDLLSAQEHHFREHGGYAEALGELDIENRGDVTYTLRATEDGFVATATRPTVQGRCVLYVGSERRAPARDPGRPACEELESRVPTPLPRRTVLGLFAVAALVGGVSVAGVTAIRLRPQEAEAPARGRPPEGGSG